MDKRKAVNLFSIAELDHEDLCQMIITNVVTDELDLQTILVFSFFYVLQCFILSFRIGDWLK